MESENKEKKMNFFNLEDEENFKKNKTIVGKRIRKNEKKEKSNQDKNNKFSFEDEIVIGVSKKEETSKGNKKPNKKKQKRSKKNKKTNNESKKQVQIIDKQTKKTKKIHNEKEQNKNYNKKIRIDKEQNENVHTKRKIKTTIKYATLLILILTAIILAMFSPLFNIRAINIVGNKKITEEEITSLSQIELEENIFKIRKNDVSEKIKENAYIDQVIITRQLPSTIKIEIQEREPAYLIEYAGSYVYIDKKGYMLEISTEKLELPILQGLATEGSTYTAGNRLEKEDLNKLTILYNIMEVAKTNEISNYVTRIDIENIQNIKLIFESKNKTAYIGDDSNLLDKIVITKKILEEEEGNAGEIFVNMDLNKGNPMFRQSV